MDTNTETILKLKKGESIIFQKWERAKNAIETAYKHGIRIEHRIFKLFGVYHYEITIK